MTTIDDLAARLDQMVEDNKVASDAAREELRKINGRLDGMDKMMFRLPDSEELQSMHRSLYKAIVATKDDGVKAHLVILGSVALSTIVLGALVLWG